MNRGSSGVAGLAGLAGLAGVAGLARVADAALLTDGARLPAVFALVVCAFARRLVIPAL
jgi:hypothetical protein